jgi:hypothetical protein
MSTSTVNGNWCPVMDSEFCLIHGDQTYSTVVNMTYQNNRLKFMRTNKATEKMDWTCMQEHSIFTCIVSDFMRNINKSSDPSEITWFLVLLNRVWLCELQQCETDFVA